MECKAPPTIHGRLIISHFAGPGRFKLGENVVICSGVESNQVSGNRTIFLIKGDGALIEIGDNTGMSNVVICAMERVSIGSWVNLGAGCRIFDTDFHSVDLEQRIANTNIPHKPVRIEDGAFIGSNALIMKGVTVGENAVIGAHAVVTRDIPAGEIWAGNPARFIRKL